MNCTIEFPEIDPGVWHIVAPDPEQPCGNHGACQVDNSTNKGFCQCDSGWSGHADYFKFDGLTCHVERQAVLGVYGAALVIITFLTLKTLVLTIGQMKEYKRKVASGGSRNNKLSITNYPPFKVLFPSSFITFPCWMTLIISKIWSPTTGRIGVDVLPTLVYVVGYFSFFLTSIYYQNKTTTTLIRSVYKGSQGEKGEALLLRFRKALAVAFCAYFIGRGTTFLTFAVPTTGIPTLIILGLLGTVCQTGIAFWSSHTLMNAIVSLEEYSKTQASAASGKGTSLTASGKFGAQTASGKAGNAPASYKSTSSKRLEKAIMQMKLAVKDQKKATLIATPLYGAFCAPPLWPYLHFINAFGIVAAAVTLLKVAKSYAVSKRKIVNTGTGPDSSFKVSSHQSAEDA